MSSGITDFDEKVKLVIGNLLLKAESNPLAKSVLTAFDSSKDVSVNRAVLSSSRYNAATLNSCAQFLDIDLETSDGERIYLEIQSFYPAICADCDQEYSVEFDSETKPALHCFLCFQGSHNCALYNDKENGVHLAGSVWLCKSCHENNNPIKPKKSKSRGGSKAPSKQPSGANTPRLDQQVSFSAEQLQSKLEQVSKNKSAPDTSDTSKRPNLRLGEICSLLQLGNCPHGVTGKTLHNGQSECSDYHPKRCNKFVRNGTNRKYGCRRGNKCMFFHPKPCPSSVSDKSCYDKNCTLTHLVGTKRYKRQDVNSSRRPDRARQPSTKKHGSNETQGKPRNQSESKKDSPNNEDFLEIRSLLTNFQINFQKEIEDLKSNLVSQENRLATFLPIFNHHVTRQFLPQAPHSQSFMFYQPIPASMHHPPQSHVPSHPMNWPNIPASGC
ncbi:hypothetical protein ACHWQZ_G017870 [Mnemiopsis leidyi]